MDVKKLLMCSLVCIYIPLCGATCGDDYAPVTRIDIHANQAITDWKAHGLPWVQRCSPYQVYLHWVPQNTLPGHCGVDAQLYACLDGFDIYAASEINNTVRADYVVEHELRHWLAGCQFGTVDGNHADPRFWYPYCGSAGCQDIRQ